MQLGNKKIQFKPTLIPTLAAVGVIALTLYLSNWQTGRATQKAALQASYDARVSLAKVNLNDVLSTPIDGAQLESMRFRTGIITGEWLENAQFVVDNKQQNAKPGYHVITPLRVTSSSNASATVILVNRGWVPRTRDYPALPNITAPPQAPSYSGVLVIPTKKYLELGADQAKTTASTASQAKTEPNQVWQNLDVQRIAAATGMTVFPLVMLLKTNTNTDTARASDSISLIEQVETPDAGVDKHRGYAFQWLALAIAISLVWLVVNVKISRHQPI